MSYRTKVGRCRTFAIGGKADWCPVPLEKIPYVDHPEIKTNEHESTEMPFRYIKDSKGQPIMPEVCMTWQIRVP